jgi:hypothetical protein
MEARRYDERVDDRSETGVTDRKTKAFRFYVSQEFIDIAADAIAAQTKKNGRFSTLRSALESSCEHISPSQIDPDDLAAFLATSHLHGDIRIHLNIYESWGDRFDQLKAKLSEIAETRVYDWVAIAYLLHLSVQNDRY